MKEEHYAAEVLPCMPDLSRTASRLTRGTALADDLVQETLTRAWQARSSFQSGTNARAWTHRILVNTYINHYRKRQRELVALEQWEHAERRNRPAAADDGLGDEVAAALGRLQPEFRHVVELVDLRGLSYQEAADRLSCPVGTVMSRLHRGRKRLRQMLGAYAVTEGIVRSAA